MTPSHKLLMNTRAAIALHIPVGVNRFNLARQIRMTFRPDALRTIPPRIEATARQFQNFTHHFHWPFPVMLFDELDTINSACEDDPSRCVGPGKSWHSTDATPTADQHTSNRQATSVGHFGWKAPTSARQPRSPSWSHLPGVDEALQDWQHAFDF